MCRYFVGKKALFDSEFKKGEVLPRYIYYNDGFRTRGGGGGGGGGLNSDICRDFPPLPPPPSP